MKIDDFLKVKQVRCITGDNRKYLTNGKLYDVTGAACGRLMIHNDNGDNLWYDMNCFEPVLDSAENPLQGAELTPEFEAVEPKFKVGDRVYVGMTGRIAQVTEIIDDDVVSVANKNNEVRAWVSNICHATPENYERLQAPFPDIEFEKPPTQADIDNEAVDKLAQAMKNKLAEKREQGYHGWETCKHGDLVQLLINHVDKGDPIDVANFCAFLFARGEQLTEAVLDE